MPEVTDYLRLWAQEVNQYGFSWILDALDWNLIEQLENRAGGNALLNQLLSDLRDAADAVRGIFDYPHFMTVYDEYAEAKVAMTLLDRGLMVAPVPRQQGRQTPDFRVILNGRQYFVEVKAFHVRDGVPIYQAMMEDGFDALADLDAQIRRGRRIAVTERVVQPHRAQVAPNYDPGSPRWLTEELVRRVGGRVESDQFDMGETLLAVDLSLLPLFGSLRDSITRCYPDPHTHSATSGVLWHLAFGWDQMEMYRPEEFEGYGNLDGRLEAQGIMRTHEYVKGMLVFSNRHVSGLHRKQEEAMILPLISAITDSHNNDLNETVCHLQPGSAHLGEFVHMVRIKAFELWKARGNLLGDGLQDWLRAKESLGIPASASI